MSQATEIRLTARRDTSAPTAVRPGLESCPPRTEQLERRRRHTIELLTLSAVGLVPWTVLLGLTLPSDYRVHAWRTTWVGFDVLLLSTFVATAILAWRRHRALALPAVATAVLLICDAWFDISLDFGTPGVWTSAALALFVDLPIAGFLLHRVYILLKLPWTGRKPANRMDEAQTVAGNGSD
jgi:hypothetical protein